MIEIVKLNKAQLASFIESDEYKSLEVLPISYHRAISHINNPRANNNDVLLILAYEKNQLLGYLGVLPDEIDKIHVGWLSCIWISPLARGKGIAKKLVLTAYELYNKHILITNFTPEAGSLYNKLGVFDDFYTLAGVRYYRKMCLEKIIPKRYPQYSSLRRFFKIFDNVFNVFWKPFLVRKIMLNEVEIKTLEVLTDEHTSFIEQHSISNFKRNITELNWIKNYPWILQKKYYTDEAKRYYFSSEEKKFYTFLFEVRQNNKLIAIIYLLNRNEHLRFPYIYYNRYNYDEKLIGKVISFLINREDPHYITLFEENSLLFQIKVPFIYKKRIFRKYLKSKEINISEKINLYDGDGDAAFT